MADVSDYFVIEGGVPLVGEVAPAGNKNAALPTLAACLLTEEPVVLRNLPRFGMLVMAELLEALGVSVQRLDPHTWRLEARERGEAPESDQLDPTSSGRSAGRF